MTTASTPSCAWMIGACISRRGLSQREAAAKLGISEQYLCDVLNGRRRVTVSLANAVTDKIETKDREAFRRDIHLLGAEQDGWQVRA